MPRLGVMRRLLAALLAIAIAGCGGGNAAESDTAAEETTADATATFDEVAETEETEAAQVAEPTQTEQEDDESSSDDVALAEAALLRLEDLPPGWAEDASAGDDEEDESKCFEEFSQSAVDGAAASADFSNDTFTVIGVEDSYGESSDDMAEGLGALNDDQVLNCLRDEMAADEEMPATVELNRLSVGDYGDEAVGLRIDFGSDGLGLVVDAIFVRKGRAGVGFSFVGVEDELVDEVISIVIDRLEDT